MAPNRGTAILVGALFLIAIVSGLIVVPLALKVILLAAASEASV